jgi:hypothetical protein
MPTYKTRKIVASLTKKGFSPKKGKSKHIKYTLYVSGKKTSIFTWISHGLDEYEDRTGVYKILPQFYFCIAFSPRVYQFINNTD